jgi:tRNA(Ile)-lysidine synthetase-like protein
MSFTKVLDFWFPNNDYNEFWFDKTPDNHIRENYLGILSELENEASDLFKSWNSCIKGKVAIIIVLDQFTRNLYRNTNFMYKNDNLALKLSKEILDENLDKELPLNFRIFVLMPYRHQKKSDYLDIVCEKINEYEKEFGSSKLLEKFKLATYQSYTNLNDRIILHEEECDIIKISDYEDVLDPICANYSKELINNLIESKIKDKNLYIILKTYFEKKFEKYEDRKIGISLSGGVDSMVILFLMKVLQINNVIKDFYAIHLEYINRDEGKKETEIISKYCNLIKVPLFIRVINYMSRTSIDRNFFENETKKVRFNSYKYLINKFDVKGFCMGHHHGDLGENVLMNIFNGRDILDLFVMEEDSIIDEVRLFRPYLNNPKSDIYYIAHTHEIPYLKDSTPDWSCRGVLRKQIMPKLVDQWGKGIYSNLAEIGEKSREWDNVIKSFVLNPIYDQIQFKKNGCKISLKKEYVDLPRVIWMKLFLKIFHEMGIHMISRKNLDSFISIFKNKINLECKFSFSNGCLGIFSENTLYIFKNTFKLNYLEEILIKDLNCEININNFKIKIQDIDPEIIRQRENITYEHLLDGYYTYTEECLDNLKITNKFDERDKTRKLFTKINLVKNYVPKITSGFGFKPNKLVQIMIEFS